MKKTTYDCVDLFKLIGSIMIFLMHSEALSDLGVTHYFFSHCVPFFFVTSAFFLFKKEENGRLQKEVLFSYVKRIAYLYIIWLIINLPNVIIKLLILKGITNPMTWFDLLFSTLFSSTFVGSWYLTASIFSAIVFYFLGKKLNTVTLVWIFLFFELFCMWLSIYGKHTPYLLNRFFLSYLSSCTGVFHGLFCFSLGKLVAEREESFKRIRFVPLCLILVFIYAVYLICVYLQELYMPKSFDNHNFVLLFAAPLLLIFCLKCKVHLKHAIVMRKMSTVIYCAQGNILIFQAKFFSSLHSLVAFGLSCCIMAVVIGIVFFLQKKTSFRWAKYMT